MQQILLSLYKKGFGILSGHSIGMIYPIIVVNDFVVSKLRQNFTEINGQKMFLDQYDTLRLSTYGIYDKPETEIIKKLVENGDVALDIGAHIGYYTLVFAKQVGENGKVFSFEPDPDSFALLKKNVEINSYSNIVLERKAVLDKTKKIKLYQSKPTNMTSVYDLHMTDRCITSKAVSLDNYFKNRRKKIDFIKMDIEGAEYLALKGMRSLLGKNKKTKMIIEFAPQFLNAGGINSEEFLGLLQEYGFKLFLLSGKKNKMVAVSAAELLEKYSLEKLARLPRYGKKSINLFCKKE